MTTNPNDQAFPVTNGTVILNGCTKREIFAIIAMVMLSNFATSRNEETIALVAIKYADALIAELNKEPKS